MAELAHGRSAAVGPRALDRLDVVLDRLHDPPLVAEWVAKARIDAVEAFVGLRRQLDAAVLELLGGRPAAGGPEYPRPHRSLVHELEHLLRDLGIDRWRRRGTQDDVDLGLVRRTNGEPAVPPELFERRILADLE